MKVAKKHNSNLFGFTIVELLVVIVVIGILVAITIVAYTGISQRAIVASIQSDLSGASKQLNMFQVTNSAYPNSVTDCPTPVSTDICLKLSPGNTVSSYSANNSANPQTYSLAIANGSNIYEVSNGTQPSQLASAPLSPVADWLATTQGDHYGNYYDLVGHNWATVSRSGSGKTIYDPTTNHIYDVPANYLGVNPRSDGKSGSEAVIEEGRTNYLLHSYGDTNSGNIWTSWGDSGNRAGTPTYSVGSSSVYGNYQRIQYTGVAGDSSGSNSVRFMQTSSTGTFSAGDSVTVSGWISGPSSGVTTQLVAEARDSSSVMVGSQWSSALTLSSTPTRYSITYSSLPANTSKISCDFYIGGIGTGDTFDISITAAQLEKGTFATSYIPTTTTAITRNADNVTVPTTNWSASAGTFLAVTGNINTGFSSAAVGWRKGSNDCFAITRATNTTINDFAFTGGAGGYLITPARPTGYAVDGLTWASGGSAYAYENGTVGTGASGITTISGMPATAQVGNYATTYYFNGPIQRLIVYNSALSSGDVSTVTSAVQNGP